MTAPLFDHRRAGALRHRTLSRRRDHAVFGADEVPARLLPPGRLGYRAAQSVDAPRDLRVGHECSLFLIEVAGESRVELLLVEEETPFSRGQNRGHRSSWRWVLDQRLHGLALARRESGNVDEPDDVAMSSRFGDHDAAIGVPHQNGGTVLSVEDELRRGDVVGERGSRVLYDANAVAVPLQNL